MIKENQPMEENVLSVCLQDKDFFKYVLKLDLGDMQHESLKWIFIQTKKRYNDTNELHNLDTLKFLTNKELITQREGKEYDILFATKGLLDSIVPIPQDSITFRKQNAANWILQIVAKSRLLKLADDIEDNAKLPHILKELNIHNAFDTNKEKDINEFTGTDIMNIDPTTLMQNSLINNGFLCRTETMEIWADQGVGKSTFLNQLAFSFAHGKETLGWIPNGKLKVLILQAEDCIEKTKRMYSSINKYTSTYITEVVMRYGEFNNYAEMDTYIRTKCEQFHPDLLIINPLYRFITKGETTKEDNTITEFLDIPNSIAKDYNLGVIVAHHPKKDGQTVFGSAALGWYFRAIVEIKSEERRGQYRFFVHKRADESINIHNRRIQWAKSPELYWLDVDNQTIVEKINDSILLKYLNNNTPISATDICKQMYNGNITKRGTIQKELDKLVEFGLAQKMGSKGYINILE